MRISRLYRGPVLRCCPAGVTALDLHPVQHWDNEHAYLFLHLWAPAFPNLTALSVPISAQPLPPPSHFPHLQQLSIGAPRYGEAPATTLAESLAAYVPQLRVLGANGLPWAQVFTAVTHTLTELTTSTIGELRMVRARVNAGIARVIADSTHAHTCYAHAQVSK